MPRKVSGHFGDLQFELVKENGKYSALCLLCNKLLANSAESRLKSHRYVCTRYDTVAFKSKIIVLETYVQKIKITKLTDILYRGNLQVVLKIMKLWQISNARKLN